ncbi:hypothetical protein [Sporosalibacterium faouarense]|uniref:hypothetical protein n=1 Tax=Sporosalibacterium faouarense TaxID=516123 RepID=UPI00141C3E2B|nr:hypothetical protein [Sporosalibacterium faouarense]MTI49509.1 hypothetical protein [Bacillota bacterium]
MNKKLILLGILIILLMAISFTGCTAKKAEYAKDLEELTPQQYHSKEISEFIKEKEKIYTAIMIFNYITIGFAFGLVIKYLLIDNELESQYRLSIVLVNSLAIVATVVSFDSVQFASFFVNKYGQIPYPTFNILIFELIAGIIIVFSIWLIKYMKKKTEEHSKNLKLHSDDENWEAWWNK